MAEGVESGTVVSILVTAGGQVKKDQTLLEIETNKATAPIPSPVSGTVEKVLVKEGDEVSVGQAVLAISESGKAKKTHLKEESQEALKTVQVPSGQKLKADFSSSAETEDFTYQSKSGFPPPASPSIRKMALDLGIDLAKVRGSAHGGRITLEDLKSYLQRLQAGVSAPSVQPREQKIVQSAVDFSKWGPVSRKPVSSIRRVIGQRMYESWTSIPHVTQFDEADITDLLDLRKKYAPLYEQKKARLTLTGLILKVVVRILAKYPIFNSSLDEAKNELVLKQYMHLGVAVDTEQGLIVPVIKNVDQKSLLELSIEMAELAEKARRRKISLEEVQGGTFTISNLGSIGGTFFTPIVNKPEVAILGVGRAVMKPVVKKGGTQNRLMLPLCLSYDHRVIDGADGARFIQELVQGLEQIKEEDLTIGKSTPQNSIAEKKQPKKVKK